MASLTAVCELIAEGSLSVTSCPPSKPQETVDAWHALNIRIRDAINMGLVTKNNYSAQKARVEENVIKFLELCQADLAEYHLADEEELDYFSRQDLHELQKIEYGKTAWRRYVRTHNLM
jgi:hypothetical protein